MPTNRQQLGASYKILGQNENQAEVEYSWLCPYCGLKTKIRSIVYPTDYERLETGGFYDSLGCSLCGKSADVRFWRSMKVD